MNKTHATIVALILGLAAVLGMFAAVRTAHLGAASKTATTASIAAQQRRLNAAEHRLKALLAAKPAKPAKPAKAHGAQRTVFVRPAPIIVHLHRHGDEEGGDGGRDD